jgi:ATP-dependent DNA ligase
MTAGRRIHAAAARRPAQLVVFDVLAAGKEDLRSRPARERRQVIERSLNAPPESDLTQKGAMSGNASPQLVVGPLVSQLVGSLTE